MKFWDVCIGVRFLLVFTRFSDNGFGHRGAKFLAEPLGNLLALQELYLQGASAYLLHLNDFW